MTFYGCREHRILTTASHLPSFQRTLNMSQFTTSSSMSKTLPTTTSSSNFRVIFERALQAYQKTTKQELSAHPLASQLLGCDSPAAILTMLQGQVDLFIQSQIGSERLKNWLTPTISVLYAFSATLGGGLGMVNVNLSICRRYRIY